MMTSFELPIVSEDEPVAPARPNILVVDDDGDTREELALLLGRDYVVSTAGSAQQALDLLQTIAFPVLLTDIRMPGQDGLAMLATIKELYGAKAPRAIVITGHAGVREAVEALRLGVVDFLTKPLDIDQLLTCIRRALAEGDAEQQQARVRELMRALETSLDKLRPAFLIVDESLSLVYANRKGRGLLEEDEGLTLSREHRLLGVSPQQTQQLRGLLQSAKDEGSGVLSMRGGPDGVPLHLLAFTIDDDKQLFGLAIDRPEHQVEAAARLQQLYELTPREAQLSEALARGMTAQQMAEQFDISVHTVRTHLKLLFAKLGTHRQVEIVRLVLSGPFGAFEDA